MYQCFINLRDSVLLKPPCVAGGDSNALCVLRGTVPRISPQRPLQRFFNHQNVK